MANVGTMEQYQGPFDEGASFSFNHPCVIGLSVSEDDYMKAGLPMTEEGQIQEKSIRFTINEEQIWLGRTYIYETEDQIGRTNSSVVLTFPDGAPASVLLNVIYCNELA